MAGEDITFFYIAGVILLVSIVMYIKEKLNDN
jgi:hypothetical protein